MDTVRAVKDNQEEGVGGVRWSAWDRRGWGDGEGVAVAALEALLDGAGEGDDNFGWAAGVVGFKFDVAIEQHCSVAISDQRVIRTTRCGERRLYFMKTCRGICPRLHAGLACGGAAGRIRR